MIKLSKVFSDGMVLQRNTDDNVIWGYGKGEVTVKFFDMMDTEVMSTTVTAAEDGYFEVKLPNNAEFGNYKISVTDADEAVDIIDITYGDVFVCGGQSNMELPLNRTWERYGDELKDACDPDIRFFRVPEKFNFHHTEEFIEDGSWKSVKMPELLDLARLLILRLRKLRREKAFQ